MDREENVVVSIERLSERGWGVGTYAPPSPAQPGQVVVVGGLPGDELSVRLGKKRRGKWRGDLNEVLGPSPIRVQPRCAHVPLCGGCSWQQMDYAAQLQEKQRRVNEIFSSLLSDAVQVYPIIACADPWRQRNKMEFSFSQNRAGEKFLGLIIAGSRGHVLNLTECHLVSEWYAKLLGDVRSWWKSSGLGAYRLNNTGALRTLVVREGKKTGDKLVMLTVSGNPDYAISQAQLRSFVDAVKLSVPEEQRARLSIFLRVQQTLKGSPTQFFEMHLYGPDHLLEKMTLSFDPPVDLYTNNLKDREFDKEAPQDFCLERVTIAGRQGTSEDKNPEVKLTRSKTDSSGCLCIIFKISPTSFFQPNTVQAEKLYSAALNMVSFPKKHVLDLYAGTATLGLAMAAKAEKVTAIEINPHACFDAESNKELNGFSNLEILCGDVGKKLEELRQLPDFIPPDLVVVDPPRTGLDRAALDHLKALKAEEILYVSCNPESQAANIQELMESGYRLVKLQSVDQFPHTPHIENIALLRLDV